MTRSRLTYSIAVGAAIQACSYFFMSFAHGIEGPRVFRLLGGLIYILGSVPSHPFILALGMGYPHSRENIVISFFYLLLGTSSFYLSSKYGRDFNEKTGIFAGTFFGVIIICFVFIVIAWVITGGQS